MSVRVKDRVAPLPTFSFGVMMPESVKFGFTFSLLVYLLQSRQTQGRVESDEYLETEKWMIT